MFAAGLVPFLVQAFGPRRPVGSFDFKLQTLASSTGQMGCGCWFQLGRTDHEAHGRARGSGCADEGNRNLNLQAALRQPRPSPACIEELAEDADAGGRDAKRARREPTPGSSGPESELDRFGF